MIARTPTISTLAAVSAWAMLGAATLGSALAQRRATPPPKPAPGESQGRDAGQEKGRRTDKPALEDDVAGGYFKTCDYSGDGWISFSEGRASIGLDRDAFAVYDKDRDGRIDLSEFKARYHSILEHGGAFPEPKKKIETRQARQRTSEEMLAAYDTSADKALDVKELKRVLEDYPLAGLAPEVLLQKLDVDASKGLELGELAALSEVLFPTPEGSEPAPKPKSIQELFGRLEPREVQAGSTPFPPRIPGPVSSFRRLDLDGDGRISLEDLTQLQRPIQIPVRINAVLATLDTDGDGSVSEAELAASMGASRR